MKKKIHLRKGRLLLTAAIFVIVSMITDAVIGELFRPSLADTVKKEGSFPSVSSNGIPDDANIINFRDGVPPESSFSGVDSPGYFRTSFNAEDLSGGFLTIINEQHPGKENSDSSKVVLENFRNDHYSVADENITLGKEAAEALNQLMSDYNEATGLSDFIVYGTDNTYTGAGSYCAKDFPERICGNTVDLALIGCGSIISYDGFDEEGWVVKHCAEYGFIVRYPEGKSEFTGQKYCPWHLRYVGKLHSAVMSENNMCLEEYVAFLKNYTQDEPFQYKLNNTDYNIYTIPYQGDSTEAQVPIRGNYEKSGDNIDTFIISVRR